MRRRWWMAAMLLVLAGCSPRHGECDNDGDCDEGFVCRSGVCKPVQDAPTGEAKDPLSISPFVISTWKNGAPATSTACNDPNSSLYDRCGTDITDASARCSAPDETTFFHLGNVGPVTSAVLTYTATVSSYYSPNGSTVSVRRSLRAISDPPSGQANLSPTINQVSWYRAGTAGPWTSPGATSDGNDRGVLAAARVDSNGNVQPDLVPVLTNTPIHFDVTDLVNACGSDCALAQFASSHITVLPGTASLVYTAGQPPTCGNGAVESPEGCDDGNTAAGDGCSVGCAVESGWTCANAPSACHTTCGDGIVAGIEQCDLGAANGPTSTCSATCADQVCSCQ